MNTFKPTKYFLVLIAVCLFTSFTTKKEKPVFQKQPKGMVYIPGGTYISGDGSLFGIDPFWMTETEVTNSQYWAYLKDLKASSLNDSFVSAYPDTSLINSEFWISDYFNYFEDELFQGFPVVGLTQSQMNGYIKWFTAKLSLENPHFSMDCRLPTNEEWHYAAAAGRSIENYASSYFKPTNSVDNHLFYFFYGDFRYEAYRGIDCQPDYFDASKSDYDFWYERRYLILDTKKLEKVKVRNISNHTMLGGFPTKANSFFPNDYGLYGTAGNVAELVVHQNGDTIAVGGSYKTGLDYCLLQNAKPYPFNDSIPQVDIGFRLVCNYQTKTINR